MDNNENPVLNGAAQLPLKTSTRPIILLGLFGLIFGFGGFLAWAFLAPLDEGVVAPGEVMVVSYKKTIQHQYGGTIKEMLVKDGDHVEAGQVLIRLNDAQPKANLANIRGEYYQALVLKARLLAERRGADAVDFPEEVVSMDNHPDIAERIRTQKELFNAKRGALQSEIDILKENIEGMSEYVRRLEELQASRARQIKILSDEMTSLRELADEGYYPRTKILGTERVVAEISGKRSEDLGNIARSKNAISEYKLTIVRRQQEFMRDVESELSEVQTKLAALKDQYAATKDILEKTEIKVLEDGTVVGLAFHTTGGVIMPGDRVMDIVPANEELIVEAKVMTTDRERVREKLKVNLMFTSLDIKKTPVIDGEVVLVSADRFTDQATNIPYYLCRIRITKEGIRKLGNHNLQPGMPVQVVIKTGERTMMEYLVKPLSDRVSVSFKER